METKNHNETLEQETHLRGSYGDKVIAVSHFPVPGNNKVVINIHGTYGSATGSNNQYLNFSKHLQKKQIANSVIYKSSRVEMEDEPNLGKYANKQRKFVGKTFSDELEDARRVLLNTVKNSQTIFGVSPEKLEITLNGNSLGGIIAFYLANEYTQVKNISTVGTGFRKERPNIPILDTFPAANELSEKLKGFRGKFMMHYGSEDNVFTTELFIELYEGATNSEKSSIHFIGVDHSFCKVGGKISEKPYEEIYLSVAALVQKGVLSSGEDSLVSVVPTHQSSVQHEIRQGLIKKYFVNDEKDELNIA